MIPTETILDLNQLALDLVGADFSTERPPEQGGPTRTSRALAIIHLAMHDAYAIATSEFEPRLTRPPSRPAAFALTTPNVIATVGSAAFAMCRHLYPAGEMIIRTHETAYWERLSSRPAGNTSADQLGHAVAAAWQNERASDGSQLPGRYLPGSQPGEHRTDPMNPDQGFLHPGWGNVRPFVLADIVADTPLDPPPPLDSRDYAEAFDQVAVLGKDDALTDSARSRNATVLGIFWGYDGSPRLGTPPRLYNQVIRQVVLERGVVGSPLNGRDTLRLLTGINVAMADAGISAWYWKYFYNFWRPVIGVREADGGWGPTGKGDENTLRKEPGDPFWLPLGAPRTNGDVQRGYSPATGNFTPNFPAYPSGHATFGSACFEFAAAFLGAPPEAITVRFVSDEFNGVSKDHKGVIRPHYALNFTLRQAIEDNKMSRIYLGVHWFFDATGGEQVGKAVAIATHKVFPRLP